MEQRIFKVGRDSLGFTLIELLVVLVLMGLLAGMVAPRLSGSYEKLPLRTATKNLAALMRLARSQAVTQGTVVVLMVDPENDRLIAAKSVRADSVANEAEPLLEEDPFQICRLPEGVKVERRATENSPPAEASILAVFFPIGNSSGGQLVLSDASGQNKVIEIDMITGTITIPA